MANLLGHRPWSELAATRFSPARETSWNDETKVGEYRIPSDWGQISWALGASIDVLRHACRLRNGSRTRGDETRAASVRGGHRPRGGCGRWPLRHQPRGEGSGVQGDGQQSWPHPAPRLRLAGWLRPPAVAATRWRTGGLHRPDQGDDPTCRLAPVAERERGDEYEQRDQNGERADDNPRHLGHSERQHHRTSSCATFLSHGSSSPLLSARWFAEPRCPSMP